MRKNTLSFIVLALIAVFPFSANAQWITSGTNILNTNTGNVGIGVTNPGTSKVKIGSIGEAQLTIASDTDLNDSDTDAYLRFTVDGETGTLKTIAGYDQGLDKAIFGYDGGNKIVVGSTGNVGIGTNTPGVRLETKGAVGFPAISGTIQPGILRLSQTAGVGVIDFGFGGTSGAGWLQATNSSNLGQNYALLLNPNGGNVGVGTTAPAAKLDVNGDVNVNGGVKLNGSITSDGDICIGTCQ